MNQKTSSKKKLTKRKAPIPKVKILASVDLTPAVKEILKSNEAKLYLTAIDRAAGKLHAMISREDVVRRHPSHAQSSG